VEPFFIGELAERAGVSRDTIRYYEAERVLPEPERSPSGYRLYGPQDVERLEFVAQAQSLGLRLNEIADVLRIVDEGVEPCIHVRERLRARLDETRARIRELRRLEERLARTLAQADERRGPPDGGCRCRIIESGAADARAAAAPRPAETGAGSDPE